MSDISEEEVKAKVVKDVFDYWPAWMGREFLKEKVAKKFSRASWPHIGLFLATFILLSFTVCILFVPGAIPNFVADRLPKNTPHFAIYVAPSTDCPSAASLTQDKKEAACLAESLGRITSALDKDAVNKLPKPSEFDRTIPQILAYCSPLLLFFILVTLYRWPVKSSAIKEKEHVSWLEDNWLKSDNAHVFTHKASWANKLDYSKWDKDTRKKIEFWIRDWSFVEQKNRKFFENNKQSVSINEWANWPLRNIVPSIQGNSGLNPESFSLIRSSASTGSEQIHLLSANETGDGKFVNFTDGSRKSVANPETDHPGGRIAWDYFELVRSIHQSFSQPLLGLIGYYVAVPKIVEGQPNADNVALVEIRHNGGDKGTDGSIFYRGIGFDKWDRKAESPLKIDVWTSEPVGVDLFNMSKNADDHIRLLFRTQKEKMLGYEKKEIRDKGEITGWEYIADTRIVEGENFGEIVITGDKKNLNTIRFFDIIPRANCGVLLDDASSKTDLGKEPGKFVTGCAEEKQFVLYRADTITDTHQIGFLENQPTDAVTKSFKKIFDVADDRTRSNKDIFSEIAAELEEMRDQLKGPAKEALNQHLDGLS